MKSFTTADLDKLARGQRVPGDVFRAVFADAEAVGDLARLVQVRELLATAEPAGIGSLAGASGLCALPDMDVTWDELSRYGEGRPLDLERRTAVERFLGKHFPEALVEPSGTDTQVDFLTNQDTAFLPPKDQGKEPNRP
jgi:hypothetical protein